MTGRLRWTTPANTDFLGIVEWIKTRNPRPAARVGQRILDAVEDLTIHPYLGKAGAWRTRASLSSNDSRM